MTSDEVRSLTLQVIKVSGASKTGWCKQKGVNLAHVSSFLSKRRERPPNDLLDALGLEWRIVRKQT